LLAVLPATLKMSLPVLPPLMKAGTVM